MSTANVIPGEVRVIWKKCTRQTVSHFCAVAPQSPLPGMPFWLCFAGLTLTHPLKLSSEVTLPRKTVLGLG